MFQDTFYYDMKMGVVWLGREETVTPEIVVINFGPARCRFE